MGYQTELRNKNRGYMNLTVWQRAMELFELVAQSISANISEGYGRRSINEYIQFLYYALGSLAETMTRGVGLQQTRQVTEPRFNEFNPLHYEVENRLLRLIQKLEQKRGDGDWSARSAEDREHYSTAPLLQYSTPPPLRSYA